MKPLARVFPTKTSMTPQDPDAYTGTPDIFTPYYERAHISVVFSWDIHKAFKLSQAWRSRAKEVLIGGPAIFGEPRNGFVPGRYLKKGVTITSRGCPFNCPWCLVQSPLKEIKDFAPGNILQDNNLLACSKSHIMKVFSMLKRQTRIDLRGGLDARLLKDWHIDELRGLKIKALWLSYDCIDNKLYIKKAIEALKRYFPQWKIRVYVLIGFKDDTVEEAEERLKFIYDLGGFPFAMLYRNKAGDLPKPVDLWKKFQRLWARPAIYRSHLKEKPNERLYQAIIRAY